MRKEREREREKGGGCQFVASFVYMLAVSIQGKATIIDVQNYYRCTECEEIIQFPVTLEGFQPFFVLCIWCIRGKQRVLDVHPVIRWCTSSLKSNTIWPVDS